MSDEKQQPARTPRDSGNWAPRAESLQVSAAPAGARNINVAGRQVSGPVQGFGQLWQKTYRVALEGAELEPAVVLADWQANFNDFLPASERFHLPEEGLNPGNVALIDTDIANVPLVSTGVMVLYRDEESFAFMTPEGHPESGWITFSVSPHADGYVVAQIQSLARAADPLYEFGFRIFGSRMQEGIWSHMLTQLAGHYDLTVPVSVERQQVDSKMQWNRAGNIRQNAQIRTTLHTMTTPVRWVRSRIGR